MVYIVYLLITENNVPDTKQPIGEVNQTEDTEHKKGELQKGNCKLLPFYKGKGWETNQVRKWNSEMLIKGTQGWRNKKMKGNKMRKIGRDELQKGLQKLQTLPLQNGNGKKQACHFKW